MTREEEQYSAMLQFLGRVAEDVNKAVEDYKVDFIRLGISAQLDTFEADLLQRLDSVWYPIADMLKRGE